MDDGDVGQPPAAATPHREADERVGTQPHDTVTAAVDRVEDTNRTVTGVAGLEGWRHLAGRVGSVAGSLVVGQALLGVTNVVAARSMSPASLGLIATCLSIGTIASTVFDNGLTSYLIREVAGSTMTLADARSATRLKRRIVILLILPLVAVCTLIVQKPLEAAVLGAIGWLVWEAQTANSLLRTSEKFAKAASAQLAGRMVGLAVTAGMIIAGPADTALSVGIASGFAAEALIDRIFLGPCQVRPTSLRDLRKLQRRSMSFGLVSLAAIGQQLDTPLVTAGGGAATGGIYAAAGRLTGPLMFLSSSLALVGPPWLARTRHDPDALRMKERRIRLLALCLCVAPVLAAPVGLVAIPFLLGEGYAGSGVTFAVLAIGAVLSTQSQGLAVILQNRGAEKVVGRAIAVGLVLGLIVTYVAAAKGGPVWAAGGFTASQLYINIRLTVAVRGTKNVLTRGG